MYYTFRAALDKNGRDVDFFLKGVRNLGRLYDLDASDTVDLLEFQHTLEALDKSFDIATKLKAVSVNTNLIDSA